MFRYARADGPILRTVTLQEQHTENEEKICPLSNRCPKTPAHFFSMLGSKGGSEEQSPVFTAFLDCLLQLVLQNPEAFEYGPELLTSLHEQVCEWGWSWGNSEAERASIKHSIGFDYKFYNTIHNGLFAKERQTHLGVIKSIELDSLTPIYAFHHHAVFDT